MSKITQLNEKAWAAKVGKDHFDFRFEKSQWGDTGKWILVYKSPFIWEKYGKENWDWEITFEVKPAILGRPEEVTEDQWKGIVELHEVAGESGYGDYEYPDSRFPITATASGLSLLKSKGLNPSEVIILIKK